MKIARPKNSVKTKVTTFDSIQELVDYIKTTPITDLFASDHPSSIKIERAGGDWYCTRNIEEAWELLRSGWVDKSKELEQKLSDKTKREATQVMRQKSVYDVVGGNASVARYLQGVPTNMIRQVRTPVKEKVMTVNFTCAFNSRVSGEEITRKAVDCLSYVKKLEDSGKRVNVNVIWATKKSDGMFAWEVPVKRSSERLSIAKLAFTLCHPSMLRRIMFSCLERDTEVPESFVWGYGEPVHDEALYKVMFPEAKIFNI